MTTSIKVLYALVIISILLSLLGVLQMFRNRTAVTVPGQTTSVKTNALSGSTAKAGEEKGFCYYWAQSLQASCPLPDQLEDEARASGFEALARRYEQDAKNKECRADALNTYLWCIREGGMASGELEAY